MGNSASMTKECKNINVYKDRNPTSISKSSDYTEYLQKKKGGLLIRQAYSIVDKDLVKCKQDENFKIKVIDKNQSVFSNYSSYSTRSNLYTMFRNVNNI